jgi:hypothetical protein
VPVRREISLCDNPSKYARVRTSLCTGERRERAETRSKLRESPLVVSSSPGSKGGSAPTVLTRALRRRIKSVALLRVIL